MGEIHAGGTYAVVVIGCADSVFTHEGCLPMIKQYKEDVLSLLHLSAMKRCA